MYNTDTEIPHKFLSAELKHPKYFRQLLFAD